ncbi:hypothetical protein LTR62_004562 [Meristemomyces frigidus]|uniref:hydroxymethylglutaryl-CoA lyase n=1 Tax=Meristemomyces frigidus TaxID=1508187 RepID=A0AAN7THD2_9PEZI|nr:hypothetical protein LTR62_004562 [Meristemomyces frigidus]
MSLQAPSRISQRAYRHLSRRKFSSTTSRRALADQIRIIEVGPRDGLQNEKKSIPVATKIELVRRLAGAGLQTIEAGSFSHPKWVPQMAASDEVLAHVLRNPPSSPAPITYQWLLPNSRGLDNFFKVMNSFDKPEGHGYPTPPPSPQQEAEPTLEQPQSSVETDANVRNGQKHEVSIFLAATESFSKRNTNCSIQESLDRFAPLMSSSRAQGIPVRAYISVALGCPFEGPDTDPHVVADLAVKLLEMGADEISVADTTGMGTAPRTGKLLRTLSEAGVRNEDLALHFHDTFGQALLNTMVSLDHGIRTFDSAVGGLGGCPYSPGATGNVATEDLVYMLHSLGAKTRVDLEECARIGEWITGEIGKGNASSAGRGTLARLRREKQVDGSVGA